MLRIRIDENGFTFQGHAGTAPAGQDTVCAAVSALAYTLALSVEAEGWLEEGNAELRWNGLTEAERFVVDAVARTCGAFAAQWPDNVSFEDARTGDADCHGPDGASQ